MLQEQLHGNGQSKHRGNVQRQPDDQQRSSTGGEFHALVEGKLHQAVEAVEAFHGVVTA